MAVKEFEFEYNPIKETVNGQAAERVIWSTKAFKIAVDAIRKGLPLKANPFCGKNVQLLKPDLVYRRTQEEIDDYIRCKNDPVYFASKCYLMTPEGLKPCILRDYQIDYLNMLKENNFTIMLSCRQAGKCLSLTSLVTIEANSNDEYIVNMLKKCYYYIKDNKYELPLYELFNIYCKHTWKWKLKYHLYKIIFKLEHGGKKRNEEKN